MLSSSKSWLHLSSCAGAAAAECVRVTSPSQATVSPLFHPSGSGQPDACSCCLCACCQALLLSLERVSCCLSGCAGASSSCPCACRQPWPLCCAPEKREVNLPVCCRKLYADEKAKLDAKQAAAKAAAMVGPLGAVRLLGSKPVSNDSTAGNHRHAQVSPPTCRFLGQQLWEQPRLHCQHLTVLCPGMPSQPPAQPPALLQLSHP